MKTSKFEHIKTSSDDDFLYIQLQTLFNQIKITQGGTELGYTLRNHPLLKQYAIKKQIDKIKEIEEKYFYSDGSLNHQSIEEHYLKNASLHNV